MVDREIIEAAKEIKQAVQRMREILKNVGQVELPDPMET
jgi:hypothetical protein